MNSFETASKETEQEQRKQRETETASRPVKPAPAPELKPEEERIASGLRDAEPEATSQYTGDLSYSCLMIPRFSDHYLTGDITESLVEWMRQICISYGWRLDAIVVRPGYFHWVMTVPLNANPAHFMRNIRRHTSERIFDEFPRYKQKNVSGEFWAPGSFVAAGSELQKLENINSFILQTRRNQGIV